MTATATTIRCDSCFAPATHVRADDGREHRCEACARRDSLHTCGETWAAVSIIGSAAHVGEEAGMSFAEIIAAVRAALDDSEWAEHGPETGLPAWASGRLEDDTHWRRLREGDAS
jgi:hypothetical protein